MTRSAPSLLLQRLEVYRDLDAGVVYPYGIGPVGVPLEEVPCGETAFVAFRPSPDKARTQQVHNGQVNAGILGQLGQPRPFLHKGHYDLIRILVRLPL